MPKIFFSLATALLFAGCSGNLSNSLPAEQTAATPTVATARHAPTMNQNAVTAPPIFVAGPVQSVVSGMFTMNAGPGLGYVHVYTANANWSGLYLQAGTYAAVVGTGSASTSISATDINVTSSAPPSVHLAGPVSSVVSGMFTMNGGPGIGYVHVYTAGATWSGLYLRAGAHADVKGTASSTWVHATSIAVSSLASPASAPAHVLTSDYLGGTNGTHSVSWSQAAPYLTWAETNVADANAISAAGIKTMMYVDPNREQTGSQMDTATESAYAHACNGQRVTDLYAGRVTQYVTNPASSAMQSVFSRYVASIAAQAHFDALFEDDSGPLSAFAPYDPFSAMPCGYSDSSWITGQIALNQASSLPIVINGLSGLNGHDPSLTIGILAGRNTTGGVFEHCYDADSQPKMEGWQWSAIENTEIQVAGMSKLFECMGTDSTPAASAVGSRIYAYASFLLGYDPNTSIYRAEYQTASGLHVYPEMGLVALQPAISQPASVSAYLQPGGTYARQFGACYLAGAFVGPCAVVVNPNQSVTYPFPFTQYHHTLTQAGNGSVDGGTASSSGPAPPATVPFESAVIAFP
jgi:hypothetical protein